MFPLMLNLGQLSAANSGCPLLSSTLSPIVEVSPASATHSTLPQFWHPLESWTDPKFAPPGGRTAWSATVTIRGENLAARYWYDGQYLNNAKEDAAEVACTKLRNPSITAGQSTVYRAQSSYGGPWAR
jgi:hypothetical protein